MNMNEFIKCMISYQSTDTAFKGLLKETPETVLSELDIIGRMAKLIRELKEQADMPASDVIQTMRDAVIQFQREVGYRTTTYNMLDEIGDDEDYE